MRRVSCDLISHGHGFICVVEVWGIAYVPVTVVSRDTRWYILNYAA